MSFHILDKMKEYVNRNESSPKLETDKKEKQPEGMFCEILIHCI